MEKFIEKLKAKLVIDNFSLEVAKVLNKREEDFKKEKDEALKAAQLKKEAEVEDGEKKKRCFCCFRATA